MVNSNFPILSYFETHIVDQCNLNCKGCAHYSNLAPNHLVNPSEFEKDIQRITELFSTIERFRIMGGEPLLHPELNQFLSIARKHLPKTKIGLVTNGSLLHKMQDGFWNCCTDNNIHVIITPYPIKIDIQTIRQKAEDHKTKLTYSVTTPFEFFAGMNMQGDSKPQEAMNNCRKHFNCPNLKDGKMYACAIAAYINYFNDHFQKQIPQRGWIDIHSPETTGEKILEVINEPFETCKFCSANFRKFKWDVSKKDISEWQS